MSTSTLRHLVRLISVPAFVAGVANAGNVRIAERPLVGPFTTIQSAVDAAFEGESLLVAPGTYASFSIDGKSVQLFVTGSGQAIITGSVYVKNLGPAQYAVLSRLKVTSTYASGNEPALEIEDVTGHVRIQDSTFLGVAPTDTTHEPAVLVDASVNVVFSSCTITGGATSYYFAGEPPVDGAIGLDSLNSSIALYECTVKGGKGSEESAPGGHGGAGYHGLSYGLFASGCTFQGGRGGGGDYAVPCPGGAGGDALVIDAGQVHLLENALLAGAGGYGVTGPAGASGSTIVPLNGSVVDLLLGTQRKLSATRIVADDTANQITITGQPGDLVFLMLARRPSFVFKKPLNGVWMIPTPMFTTALASGTIGAGGTLVIQRTFDIADGSAAARFTWLQALCVDTSGQATLTGPAHVLSLDAASGPDCNGNGRQDAVDVLFGGATDCDLNLTPDTCEADCNGNGIVDACDISSHSSPDVNLNGVPDECEAQFLTLFVDPAAAPGGNGSQALPFQTLLQGVSASLAGDTIVMADGLYQGPSNRNISLGGRTLKIRSANGPANCLIDCQSLGRALLMTSSETATIEGISFTRGTTPVNQYGGAIDAVGAHLTLRNCKFTSSTANRGGGALRISLGTLRLESCQFTNNTCTNPSFGWGGAVYSDRATLEVRDGLFADNQGRLGGALYITSAVEVSHISHTTFRGNHATYGGGAIYDSGGPAGWLLHTVDDCLFAGNNASLYGGALSCGVSQIITNSTFVANSAGTRGGAIDLSGGFSHRIDDSVLFGDSAPQGAELAVIQGVTVTYSDIQGGQAGVGGNAGALIWGAGNIDSSPQFTDPDGPDNNAATFGDNDYSLSLASPCIDAGNNAAMAADLFDIDGDGDTTEVVPLDLLHQPRRVDVNAVPDTGAGTAPIVDMGALEHQG